LATGLLLLLQLLAAQADPSAGLTSAFERAFASGLTFAEFTSRATAHRSLWTRDRRAAEVPVDLAARLRRAGQGLRILVVAEDWCIDSANTVPVLARTAEASGVALRIVDRVTGRPLLDRFRTADGRTATPLVVVLRPNREPRAWVERPKPLRDLFASLLTDSKAAQLLDDRQRWYDEDGGTTAMGEIVALAEESDAP
jgi:hypothetical protein